MPRVTVEQARALYAGADSVHDFDHVLRVLAMAEHLAALEGADLQIVRQAALLHDIQRAEDDNIRQAFAMQVAAGADHALLAAEAARSILAGEDAAFIDAVAHAIEAHRFRNDIEPRTIEAQVLFDADKLDAIGAVGVARAFAYSGAHGLPLWGEVSPGYTPGVSADAHTPHHEFEIKLKHIRDRLYTAGGRRIAEERHRFMLAFFERLAAEVRGES